MSDKDDRCLGGGGGGAGGGRGAGGGGGGGAGDKEERYTPPPPPFFTGLRATGERLARHSLPFLLYSTHGC